MPFPLTPQEDEESLKNLGALSVESTLDRIDPSAIPKEFQALLGFSVGLVEAVGRRTVLLRIEQYGIWANEVWNLFYALRKANNFDYSIEDVPDERISGEEVDYLQGVVLCGLLSGWDLSLQTPDGQFRFFASHDGWFKSSDPLFGWA